MDLFPVLAVDSSVDKVKDCTCTQPSPFYYLPKVSYFCCEASFLKLGRRSLVVFVSLDTTVLSS